MMVRGDWLSAPALRRVLAVLTDAGHRALIVGGAVRNDLLGAPISDIDLATDARPDRVAALMKAAGLRVIPTGIDHGTLTVIAAGQPFEITTFRRDVATDGRRATVAFADDPAEDAQRRDFTMNALYATPDGRVIDPTGGLADLAARRLRFVGDAATRIAEDYLRILRLYRFWAQYGDPDPATHATALAAVRAQAEGLARISRERIGAEMRKLLAAPDPLPMLEDMAAAGVLAIALPGAQITDLAALIAQERATNTPPTALRRLAALGGDDPTAALRLSRAEGAHLSALAAPLDLPGPQGIGALAYRHGAATATDAVLIAAARAGAPPPPDWRDRIAIGTAAVFPLRAADLPHLSGPALGARLKQAEARWIASGFAASRDDLRDG
ncbi:CCA tRNA nucleotidyltransferase [Paracoccus sp. p4-l81]|uniref:CCA tRNA nucleotidyltransferase n=1 Tax=unclassified Paracoccus (in: a-proteobacteria) TaxID=2688777 RepID=UPI0035BB62E0